MYPGVELPVFLVVFANAAMPLSLLLAEGGFAINMTRDSSVLLNRLAKVEEFTAVGDGETRLFRADRATSTTLNYAERLLILSSWVLAPYLLFNFVTAILAI